jgi:hypothetical protein
MSPFLTPKEGIALDLVFACMGESRINRTLDEYASVAVRAPKLAALHAGINEYLRDMDAPLYRPFEILTFKKGGRFYETFPTSLSIETIRRAWVKSGMRELQLHQKQQDHTSLRTN